MISNKRIMKSVETLLIKRQEVNALLTMEACIDGVEHAFRLRALGKASAPGILGIHARDGGFHIKAGILSLNREYFVSKLNANFPQNRLRNGLPTIQGIIIVCDATDGRPLAVLDSSEITILRTGAATAIAAKYLSNTNATTVTICGCGNQGRVSLHALTKVRKIENVFAYDIDPSVSDRFAAEMSGALKIDITTVANVGEAVHQSDICITCTPSKKCFLRPEHIRPGTFIAAVGADSEDKQELDPALLKNTVIVDSVDQAARIGELHHALREGVIPLAHVQAELGEVIAGTKPGRLSESEIIIFDSTGTALQDVAAAAIVYEEACKGRIGMNFDFAE
jgi:alanine dehydrogenase